jgi:hypothetical protein
MNLRPLPFALALLSLSAAAGAGLVPSSETFLAAAAHAEGANGSFFATDVRIWNPASEPARLRISWLPAGRDNSGAVPVERIIAAGETLAIDDVVNALFGASGPGGIRISSDRPVAVVSRTYNRTATGTFAQFVPGRSADEALATGARASLLGISKGSAFRTNVGMLALGAEGATARIVLRDSTGAELAASPVGLFPYGFNQFDPFVQLGLPPSDNARLDIEVTSGRLLAYASVVDASTNDPNFVEPVTSFVGDGVVAGSAELAISTTRTLRSVLDLELLGGALDRIVVWDQLYDGKKGDGGGCTALVDLSTLPGRAIPIASDGSFTASLTGSSASATLSGTLHPDGRASGSYSVTVGSGSCTGSFAGSWSGRRR